MEENEEKKDGINVCCKILLGIQYVLFGFVYMIFVCSCGHHYINIVPVMIFFIIQFILLKILTKNHSTYIFEFMFTSIVLLIVVAFLSRNDMDKLHRMEIVSYEDYIANEVENSITTRSLEFK